MLSERIPESWENCVNFCFRSSPSSGARAGTENGLSEPLNLRAAVGASSPGGNPPFWFCGALIDLDTPFGLKPRAYAEAGLTVKLIEDLRHPLLRLDGVDQGVLAVHGVHDAHVVVVVPH